MNASAQKRGRVGRRVKQACLTYLLLGLAVVVPARATELVRYTFDGAALTPGSVDSRASASNFSYFSDGVTNFVAGNPASGDAFRLTAWPTNAALDDHFLFTLTMAPGYVGTLDSLAFDQQRSTDGPMQWVVRYSLDNINFFTLGSGDSGSANAWHSELADGSLPLDVTGTIYVRLYATNAASAAGTWRLDNVVLNGTFDIDTGLRSFRSRASDSAHSDRWSASTNAGTGTIGISTGKRNSGNWSLGLTGSPTGAADPNVIFDNVSLTGVLTNFLNVLEPVVLSFAFGADNPDTGDDLYLDLSYDNGATWTGTGSVKVVDGFGNSDVEFGATNAVNPATVTPNPYTLTLGFVQTQIAVRVRFDESVANNTADTYYIDDLQLRGVPVPVTNPPSVSGYAAVSNVTSFGARVSTHVRGGYPYPNVNIYYGPTDGGTNAGAWSFHRALEQKRWGVFSAALTNLISGQVYYYRAAASNAYGVAWTSTPSNFVTQTAAAGTNRAFYLDSIGVAAVMPVALDRDGNGLSDRWEGLYLGGLGNNPNADADNDGISNAREVTAGTHPMVSNSHMRIVVADVESPTSTSFRVTIQGGGFDGPTTFGTVGDRPGRTFRIGAASDVALTKVPQSAVSDGSTGTNYWTDVNATALYTSRYYQVAVSYAGSAYTNSEEWAMHVQRRGAGESFLVCVPVDYGSNAANNVNGSLGQQLARGLHANGSLVLADRIEFYDANKDWKLLYLRTNVNGSVYWYDPDVSGPADVTMTPGMGFWVVRGSGSAYRGNTVFGGKSWLESSVSPIALTTNDGSWNIFGWPLPTPRWHYNLGNSTPANQLGFENLASGGTSNGATVLGSYKGDEIWVWGNNEWYRFYWLMDHISANRNGRWWDRFVNDYANFPLEVGHAYYYKHVTNQWGGVNFSFTPDAP